jgi:hypothetical protein
MKKVKVKVKVERMRRVELCYSSCRGCDGFFFFFLSLLAVTVTVWRFYFVVDIYLYWLLF